MVKRDFHGWTYADALQEAESVIGGIRMRGVTESVEFITGHGAIQIGIMELFNSYQIDVHQGLANSGTIIATID